MHYTYRERGNVEVLKGHRFYYPVRGGMIQMSVTHLKKFQILSIVSLASFYLLMSFFIGPFADNASAAAEDDIGKFVEGAKKEGNLSVYGATNMTTLSSYAEGFTKRYPFIKVNPYRADSDKILTKVLTEARLKTYIPDVFKGGIIDCWVLKEHGLVAKYISPESRTIAEEFRDPDGYWVAHDAVTRVEAYNTRLVAPKDVPKVYEDLLDPKWKGKMGLENAPIDWFYAQLMRMGREKGIDYMKKLARQKIQFRPGKTLLAQLLAAGEIAMGIALNGHTIEQLKRQGAPVEWVPLEPVVISPGPIVVMAHAPHPNAARLFVNYMHSTEGQRIIRRINRIPLRPDVLPDPPRLIQGIKFIHPDPVLIKKMDEYTNLFQDIFLKNK